MNRSFMTVMAWLVCSALGILGCADSKDHSTTASLDQNKGLVDMDEPSIRRLIPIGMEETEIPQSFGKPVHTLFLEDGVRVLEYRLTTPIELISKESTLCGFDVVIKAGRVSALRPIFTRTDSIVPGSDGQPWLDVPPPKQLAGREHIKCFMESIKLVRQEMKMTLAERRSLITKVVFQMDALLDDGDDVQVAVASDVIKLLLANFEELKSVSECEPDSGCGPQVSLRKLARFFHESDSPSVKELRSPRNGKP